MWGERGKAMGEKEKKKNPVNFAEGRQRTYEKQAGKDAAD